MSSNTATSTLTLDFGDICRNLSEIHRILSEIDQGCSGKAQEDMFHKGGKPVFSLSTITPMLRKHSKREEFVHFISE